MKIYLKLLKAIKIIIISQLLSIIFAIIGRVYINSALYYRNLLTNPIILSLSIILLVSFCIIISIIFLNGNIINIVLISISYPLYCKMFMFSRLFIFNTNTDPNDYGIGILGMGLEIFLEPLLYAIVIVSSIVAIFVHRVNNDIKNKN